MPHFLSIAACSFAALTWLLAGHAPAQEGAAVSARPPVWELAPYRIQICVVAEPSPRLAPQFADELAEELAAEAEAAQGGLWQVAANQKLAAAPRRLLRELPANQPPATIEAEPGIDKLIFVAIRWQAGRFEITAREWDTLTRLWNLPVSRTAMQSSSLATEALPAVVAAFGPVARIEEASKQDVTIRLRAGALPRRDGSYLALDRAAVLRPAIITLDEHGQPQSGGVTAIPWTYLTPQSGPGAKSSRAVSHCQVTKSLAGDVLPPYHPRQMRVAVGLAHSTSPVRLKLIDSGNAQQPLAGYEIRSQRANSAGQLLLHGLTNRQGEAQVAFREGGLHWLSIVRGNDVLASRPIVPGLDGEITIAIPGDRGRLEIAAALAELNDDLLDALARHMILTARLSEAIRQRDVSLTGKISQEIRASSGNPRLSARLSELEKQVAGVNEAARSRLTPALNSAKQASDKLKELLAKLP